MLVANQIATVTLSTLDERYPIGETVSVKVAVLRHDRAEGYLRWSVAVGLRSGEATVHVPGHYPGVLAGRLFSIETYVGLGVVALALLLAERGRFKWGYLAGGLLALQQWALRPVMDAALARGSVAGLSFGAWHGVAGVFYLAACAAVLVVIWNAGDLYGVRGGSAL